MEQNEGEKKKKKPSQLSLSDEARLHVKINPSASADVKGDNRRDC